MLPDLLDEAESRTVFDDVGLTRRLVLFDGRGRRLRSPRWVVEDDDRADDRADGRRDDRLEVDDG